MTVYAVPTCAFFFGYLLGSVPFGLLLARVAGYGDIRAIGSGNIGATNVLRTGNKKLAAATLALDAGKGAAAVLLAGFVGEATGLFPSGAAPYTAPYTALVAGFGAVIGHIFSVWLRFKGGKGVATTLGMYLAAAPFAGLAACATWLAVAVVTRYSSLSALIALALAPLYAFLIYKNTAAALLFAAIGGIVFIKHRANIRRLARGEEPKIGKKKQDGPGTPDAGLSAP